MTDRRILLADDSPTVQKVVNLTFADEGIEVICTSDGDSAFKLLSEFIPDVVLADVNMPGRTGYELCKELRERHDTRNVPVILLVGSFEQFDEERAFQVGANDYLTKPFQSIRQLIAAVSNLMPEREPPVIEAATPLSDEPIIDMPPLALASDDTTQDVDVLLKDDEDIDSLYRDSFSNLKITGDEPEFDQIEVVEEERFASDEASDAIGADSFSELGDASLDDELIETEYAHPPAQSQHLGSPELLEARDHEPVPRDPVSESEPNEMVFGFDEIEKIDSTLTYNELANQQPVEFAEYASPDQSVTARDAYSPYSPPNEELKSESETPHRPEFYPEVEQAFDISEDRDDQTIQDLGGDHRDQNFSDLNDLSMDGPVEIETASSEATSVSGHDSLNTESQPAETVPPFETTASTIDGSDGTDAATNGPEYGTNYDVSRPIHAYHDTGVTEELEPEITFSMEQEAAQAEPRLRIVDQSEEHSDDVEAEHEAVDPVSFADIHSPPVSSVDETNVLDLDTNGIETASLSTQTSSVAKRIDPADLPAEFVDAIADRVADKILQAFARNLARSIVPEVVDMISQETATDREKQK